MNLMAQRVPVHNPTIKFQNLQDFV